MVTFELSARIGALIVRTASNLGGDVEALSRASGFELSRALDPDARISFEQEERLWQLAASSSGHCTFGLEAAKQIKPGAFDVLDYAIRTAPTLRVALQRLARYNRLEHDAAIYTASETPTCLRIEHSFRYPGVVQNRHGAECTLAAQVVVATQLVGSPVYPARVQFRHAAPADDAAHRVLFGTKPSFGAAVNAIEWDRDLVDRPLPHADPALSAVIERHAEASLRNLPEAPQSCAERTRGVLLQALGQGHASLKHVADKLKLSERSLQRRLAVEGLGFEALLDEVRRELSLRYLADPKIAISEVAYLLGYSEPSPFHRAFRRWTGTTPSEMRKRAA